MLELDEVVRQNQLTRLPIAKSGRAEAELIGRYPHLLDLIERGKHTKVDSVSLQTRLHEREAKVIGGSRAKATFLEDFDQSPPAQKSRPGPSRARNSQSKSPALRPVRSIGDFMFDMDEVSESDVHTQNESKRTGPRRAIPDSNISLPMSSLSVDDDNQDFEETEPLIGTLDATAPSPGPSPSSYQPDAARTGRSSAVKDGKKPWGSPIFTSSKLHMKDIMAQDSSSRASDKSPPVSLSIRDNVASTSDIPAKLSQRERKLRQQQQQVQPPGVPSLEVQVLTATPKDEKPASPWQIASRGPKVSLKDVLGDKAGKSPPSSGSAARTPSPMTLRQTVAGKAPSSRRAVSGSAQPHLPAQKRSVSSPNVIHPNAATPTPTSRSSSSQTPIHSIRHTTPVEPTLQLSMADILSQQQTEKEIIKEAAAKRSLQEIQEEQAFQEWWDEESRRVRAEEEETRKPAAARGGKGVRGKIRGGSRGRGRGRGRGGGGGKDRGGDGGRADSGEGADAGTGGKEGKKVGGGGQRGRER